LFLNKEIDMAIVSSITRMGVNEPFELQVARGQITFHNAFCQFGINGAVGTSLETVWVGGSTYSFPVSATTTTVSSSSADDTSAGTGARTVLVEGVNASYTAVSETASLNGQTGVTLTNQYLRVNKITILTAGSGGTSAGSIYVGTGTVTTGVPAVILNRTGSSSNESEAGFYTVPAGYTAYITRWTMSSANSTAESSTRFVLRVRPYGGVFGYKAVYTLPGNGIYECEAAYPLPLPEKTDLEIMSLTSVDSAYVSTQLQMVLIKNDSQTA
jgi:hypothetical protein